MKTINSKGTMMAFDVLVRGRVAYEAGCGATARIPMGHCRVAAHKTFVSVEWRHERGASSTIVTSAEFEEWLQSGAVMVLDAAQLARA